MIRVYVAGAYSAGSVIRVLENMRIGIQTSAELLSLGYAPFCPWLDFQYSLHKQIPLNIYYDYSIAWLDVSEAVLVVDNPLNIGSKGLAKELDRAKEIGIPVFYSIEDLQTWANAL